MCIVPPEERHREETSHHSFGMLCRCRLPPAYLHFHRPAVCTQVPIAPGAQHVCAVTLCRLKREEQRIAKEIEEREQEEARKLLDQAQKKGAKKLNIADGQHLDKNTLMNQVWPSLNCISTSTATFQDFSCRPHEGSHQAEVTIMRPMQDMHGSCNNHTLQVLLQAILGAA